MTDHHPAPWYVDEAGVVADGWGVICTVDMPDEFAVADEEKFQAMLTAHACMIAAAPQMLAALKAVLQAQEQVLGPAGWLAAVRAAVDKAEGRFAG